MEIHHAVEIAVASATNRFELWSRVINELKVVSCAEIGVFRGAFAQHILRSCDTIEKYFMVDPWRHLDDWNKPANVTNEEFDEVKQDALAKTDFAGHKRVILQGKTTNVSDKLPDEGLDFAYVDGDHTLRGITIDLIRIWPKIRNGGILAGDDFSGSVWQHGPGFEPTFVFPLAVYFAEAIGATIYGLPFDQFAIVVDRSSRGSFAFHDLTGSYKRLSLRDALGSNEFVKRTLRKLNTDSYKRLSLRDALGSNGFVKRTLRKLKRLISSH